MRRNIAAGGRYAGILTYGHNCDDYNSLFEDNVAHSIQGYVGLGLYFRGKDG